MIAQGTRPWKWRKDPESQTLVDVAGLSPLTLQVCWMRGYETVDAIQHYLEPKLEDLTPPHRIRDLPEAVERLAQARAQGDRIRVFSDYDVDGTTGASLLTWVFREMGFDFDVVQPDRFKDGYGLQVAAVEAAHASGAKVLITVDCGITAHAPATRARELGIDLIVVDHHQVDPKLGVPEAFAVIDPHRADCDSGLKELCGCGLAFYLSMALRAKGRELGWFADGKGPNLKQHLDLVVMATAADMVPLVKDNHILVRHGMEVLKNTQKPGVRALLRVAGIEGKSFSPSDLGFAIGPRINASGRLASANLAWEMLTTVDGMRGMELATELNRLNEERMKIQNEIWDQVRARVEQAIAAGQFQHAVVVADESWHEGVIGIVASRVTETFRRPAAVISLREGKGKASVRSYGGKDVLEALRMSAEHLIAFGGHKYAAGFSIECEKVEAFTQSFNAAVGSLTSLKDQDALWVDAICSVEDLTPETLHEIERMGPFGPGNPEPVFILKASVNDHRVLKGRHLKLNLTADTGSDSLLEAIWFHAAEKPEVQSFLDDPTPAEWAGVPELNRFRGRITPTLRVRDWRPL